MGRGVPLSSRSAVWSVMSRSTLMTLLEIVVPVVSSGISFDFPGPRYVTVPPCSQLTRRIVAASTLRRKALAIMGITTTTKPTMIAIRTQPVMSILSDDPLRERVCRLERGHRAAIPCRIDGRDPDAITGAHRGAERAIVLLERGEQLYDLSVEIDGDEALTVLVERGNRCALVIDAALEHQRRLRDEAKGEVPDRRRESPLEDYP